MQECHKHAIQRAKERYNLDLSYTDIYALIKQIQEGSAKYLGQSYPGSYWLVHFRGKPLKVVYHGIDKRISTFLPLRRNG